MASRSVLQLYHAETDGDVLGNKAITVTKPDGSPLGVSLYDQVSGGAPDAAPETNSVGLRLLYANYADLDAAAVGRVKVSYSDDPLTTFDDAFWPDPLDLFVDGMTRARTLAGGLSVSRASASAALTATNSSTGDAFAAGDGYTSLGALRVGKSGTNEIVSINLINGLLPSTSTFLVAKTPPVGAGYVVADFLASVVNAAGDVGALRAYINQTAAGVGTQLRAGEFHTGRTSAAPGGVQTVILECGLHVAEATGVGNAVGIRLGSYPIAAFGADPAVRANEALYIVGGDGTGNGGWTNAIRYEESNVGLLFNVDYQGGMISGTHVPRGTSSYSLGAANNVWASIYSTSFLSDGIGAAFGAGFRVQPNSSATITPAQIVANTDNYSPTGLATAQRLRLSSDASRNITGIVAQPAGTVLHLQNLGAFPIVLKHEVTSTAANRFNLPSDTDVTIPKLGAYSVIYDGVLTRWTQYVG